METAAKELRRRRPRLASLHLRAWWVRSIPRHVEARHARSGERAPATLRVHARPRSRTLHIHVFVTLHACAIERVVGARARCSLHSRSHVAASHSIAHRRSRRCAGASLRSHLCATGLMIKSCNSKSIGNNRSNHLKLFHCPSCRPDSRTLQMTTNVQLNLCRPTCSCRVNWLCCLDYPLAHGHRRCSCTCRGRHLENHMRTNHH